MDRLSRVVAPAEPSAKVPPVRTLQRASPRHENVGEERRQTLAFLRTLDRFDEERGWERAGYRSLWDYLLRSLHLRESAAGRRIGGMKLLRKFPQLAGPLGDGRLCLSTLGSLGKVLTEENADDLIARSAWLTMEETEQLVASVRPVTPPRDGLRRLPDPAVRPAGEPAPPASSSPIGLPGGEGREGAAVAGPLCSALPTSSLPVPARPPSRPTLEPVSADRWSLRVTLSAAQKEDLDTLRALLSHEVPDGDLEAVLEEAVRCALEKHGKRKGAVRPERTRKAKPPRLRPAGERQPVPAEVKRQVWERDGGRCTYVSKDGRRCESRWQLEYDHVESARLGGPVTADDLRLRCKPHNLLHAEQTFGRAYMARFRRARRPAPPAVDSTPDVGSAVGRGRHSDPGS